MKINWNWGTGIFITIVLMIAFLAFMVSKTFEYKINKVTEEYYEEGLKHSEQMDRLINAKAYAKEFTVTHTDVCTIHIPDFFIAKKIDGNILFFRPSDYSKDLSYTIKLDTNNNQVFTLDDFYKGKYVVKANFSYLGDDYYFENDIIF